MAYLRTRFLLTLVLSIASLSVFAVDLVIPTNSDYRFRDINSVSIGPALDETNFLEVYVGANGFITVTGIEFPKAELTGCQVDSASLLVNSTSIDDIPGSLVTVVGKNSDGSSPELSDVTGVGLAVGSFNSIANSAIAIPLNISNLQTLIDGASSHILFVLRSSVVTMDLSMANSAQGAEAGPQLMVSCGAQTTYTVGGDVSGLTGAGLELENNGGDALLVAADGPFIFITQLADSAAYAVTVSAQPTGQTCSVTNNDSGNIATADVTDVAVTCVDDVVPTYSVGGTVSGLTGTGLALQNNGADTLPIAADGPFTFVTDLVDTTAYAVTVSTQPTDQTCSVTNGNGAIVAADVTNVGVTCEDDVVPPVEPPPPATPIPTTSQWALIMLSMLLGLMVFANRRRLF